MSDYIPRREADFVKWAQNFVLAAQTYANDLDIPAIEVTQIKGALAAFSTDLELARGPERSPVIIAKKNEEKSELISLIRAMVRFRLQNPLVTPAMRIEFGLTPRDTIRTEHHDVPELVEFELKLRGIREIVVNFWVKGAADKAKPEGYDGAVLIWSVEDLKAGDKPPAGTFDLTQHTMASKTPYALKFPNDEDRGKTVYIAASWQNERGNTGAWSEIQSAIIP